MRRVLSACLVWFVFGCGDDPGATFNPDNEGGRGGGGGGSNGCDLLDCTDAAPFETKPPCVGLQCQQVDCMAKGQPPTTLTGTVFAPNATLPLYNVIVYVPNAPLDPIPNGASCDKCGSTISGKPIVTTLSDSHGRFTLKDVPVGSDIPVVFQVGKWRRKVTIPAVKECVDNPVADPQLTRLPKNQQEGDLPKIAVTSGGCDPLGCILPKIGVAASEVTPANGNGKINIYIGTGGGGPGGSGNATTFWSTVNNLKPYDIVVLSCECNEYLNTKPMAARQAMKDYLDLGGRVFASHYHYAWFQYGIAPFPTTATWQGDGMGPAGGSNGPFLIDTTFPKGMAFADWLSFTSGTPMGQMPINEVRNDVGAVNMSTSQRWVYANTNPYATKYLSFNAPVGLQPDQQCGKAVFGDMHIGSGGGSVGTNYPAGCTATLSPQEKALAFLLFDLSSCIQKETDPPKPPTPN